MSDEYLEFEFPEDFDPRYQLMNYTSVAGESSVSFHEIDYYNRVQVNNAIILGVRIGAAGLTMLALFIISRNKKTPVFILNQICLLMIFIHSVLYICYILGGYGSLTFMFTGFEELISNTNVNVSIAANFLQVLLVAAVESSLVFQVRTIFKDPSHNNYAYVLTAISTATALSVFVLYLYNFSRFAVDIFNDRVGLYSSSTLQAQPILFASSINFMSALLIGKLILAIRSRRYLGLKQFDGFHILLIMTTQSLIIPSIVLILTYAIDDLTSVSLPLVTQLLVVLSLPLSSMWAASANDSTTPTSTAGSSFARFTSYQPSTAGASSFYSGTLRNVDDEYEEKEIMKDSLVTPTTAIDEEAKRYYLVGNQDDEHDDGIIHKTIHEISSDRSF